MRTNQMPFSATRGLYYKTLPFVMQKLCCKLECLYKLVCLGKTIQKILAFHKISQFPINYGSVMFLCVFENDTMRRYSKTFKGRNYYCKKARVFASVRDL
jgi:hypothetical protein